MCGEELKIEKGNSMPVKFLLDNESDNNMTGPKVKEMDEQR